LQFSSCLFLLDNSVWADRGMMTRSVCVGMLAHPIYERHHGRTSTLYRLERLLVYFSIARCTTAVLRKLPCRETCSYSRLSSRVQGSHTPGVASEENHEYFNKGNS